VAGNAPRRPSILTWLFCDVFRFGRGSRILVRGER
jgi:hypothetical protein